MGNFVNMYNEMTENFMNGHNVIVKIEYKEERGKHFVYDVKIERDGKAWTLEFTGSKHDYMMGLDPNAYDVLASLQKYEVGTLDEFADNYYYNDGSHRISEIIRIYEFAKDEWEHVRDMFGDCLDELREIE